MAQSKKMSQYSFSARIWKFKGKAGWYFVTLPSRISKKIRSHHGLDEEGWGRLKTQAMIGRTKWSTAVWYDSKVDTYLLPIKLAVRKSENIKDGQSLRVTLHFQSSRFTSLIKKA